MTYSATTQCIVACRRDQATALAASCALAHSTQSEITKRRCQTHRLVREEQVSVAKLDASIASHRVRQAKQRCRSVVVRIIDAFRHERARPLAFQQVGHKSANARRLLLRQRTSCLQHCVINGKINKQQQTSSPKKNKTKNIAFLLVLLDENTEFIISARTLIRPKPCSRSRRLWPAPLTRRSRRRTVS